MVMRAINQKMDNKVAPGSFLIRFRHSLYVFCKAQLSAFIGALFDYSLMISLTEYASVFYSYSIIISGAFGAVINYSLNRYWTFKTHDVSQLKQLRKFVCVVAASVILKSAGTYLLTELLKLDYKLSRFCIDVVVSFGINFPLQKYWVFRK